MTTYISAHLTHLHFLLHLDDLLLLGPGKGPGNTNNQCRGAEYPKGLAAEGENTLHCASSSIELAGDRVARGGRNDVAQGVQSLSKGLVCRVVVGLCRDFGV